MEVVGDVLCALEISGGPVVWLVVEDGLRGSAVFHGTIPGFATSIVLRSQGW